MKKGTLLIGNFAASFDGKIALPDGSRINISCGDDFYLRDCIRSVVDGVIIGSGTLIADNPSLLIKNRELIQQRKERGCCEQPAGIVICGKRRLPSNNIFFSKSISRRMLITGCNFEGNFSYVEVHKLKTENPNIEEAVQLIYSLGIETAIVEGGGSLLFSLLEKELLKEFYVSFHPIIIGGKNTPTFFDGRGFDKDQIRKIKILDQIPLSDGGITFHCIMDGALPKFIYKDKKISVILR